MDEQSRISLIFQALYGAIAFVGLIVAAIVFASMWGLGLALAGVGAVYASQVALCRALAAIKASDADGLAYLTFAAVWLWRASLILAFLSFIATATKG